MEFTDRLTGLPMTVLESKLKEMFLKRPELRERILTSEELMEYIIWMARTHGKDPQIHPDTLPVRPANPRMAAVANKLLEVPRDQAAIAQLALGYDDQREDRYFPADRDISVSRMLRYMPAHWHTNEYFEIYYSFSGDCAIHFQNEVIPMKQGTVLIVAPTALHASPCYCDDGVLVYYMLRASTFDQVFWNQLPANSLMASFFRRALSGQHPASYLHFETGSDPEIRRLLHQIHDEYYADEPYSSALINALMTTFFILLLRRYEGTVRLPRTEDFYWKHQFSAILSHIQTHYAEVTLADLAQRFHYSEKQISRIVRDRIGISYNQLILKLRMEKAATLLRQRRGSVEAVAAAVGYSTVSSFYRAFTKYFGCTPGSYQKEPE